VYFALGRRDAAPVALGRVLPELRKIAAEVRKTGRGQVLFLGSQDRDLGAHCMDIHAIDVFPLDKIL
jgi:hypothetical protein